MDQNSEPFENISEADRTIMVDDRPVIVGYGTELPWLTFLGMGLAKVWGIRGQGAFVEFGMGNQEPPIVAWVSKYDIPDEWPQ